MLGDSNHSSELNRRLHIVKELAEKAEKDSVLFMEVSYKPLVSLFVTTGEVTSENKNKRSVHLRFVSEPHHYSEVLNDIQTMDTDILGLRVYNNLLDNPINKLDMKLYKEKFDSVCGELDAAKSKYHGICCHEDGDEDNTSVANVFVLHVCDIMNLLVCKKNETIPELELTTNLLKSIDDKVCIGNELNLVTETNREFFMSHIDYFYVCYAYIGNTSFTPIRTRVEKNSQTFVISSFFTNDDHFNNHQGGKMMQFNQNNERFVSRMIYRSI